MKRIVTILIILLAVPAIRLYASAPVGRETFVYAVKGADTLRLDKYDVPGSETVKPCVVFMFGGGFVTGTRDREDYVDFFEFLARQGFITVSIDYRLGMKDPEVRGKMKPMDMVGLFRNAIMMAVEDLYSATGFLLDNAGEWGVNRDVVILCGSSAGAISVLQAEYERANGAEIAQVLPDGFHYAGVISFAGAIFSSKGNLKWKEEPAPVILFHGDADRNVPYRKIRVFRYGLFGSQYIAKRYGKNDFPYWLYTEENADHRLAESPMTSEREEIMSFLRKYVIEGQHLVTNTVVTPLNAEKVKKNFGIKTYIKANFGGN